MRRFAILLLSPLLLAPIRYQSGDETITLNPSQGPAKTAIELPAAGPLTSPTVIMVSPSFLLPTPITPTTPSPTDTNHESRVTNNDLMPETSALICKKALETLAEITVLSYQQARSQPVMNLTIAAATAAGQATARVYPTLTALPLNFAKLPYYTPQYPQIRAGVEASQATCRNPNASYHPAPGSRIPVPRPN
ncbi:MAG: hypothetical protein GC129_00965 [Proteobacteria bacterium]|nr:hypothetical protein [Pseudomonadota bacterium]